VETAKGKVKIVNTQDVIPFTKPYLTGKENDYVANAINRLELVGDGPSTHLVEEIISRLSGGVNALLTPSCTDALDLAGMLLDLEPGDEVIVPGFTFTSTATAFAQRNAKVVFADVNNQTLNIDPAHVESLITNKTRAISIVHYAGIACDIDAILKIAAKHNLTVIEDNAHGFGGTYRESPLGSFGDMATLSFHGTKNIQCGEGGAFLTRHQELADRAHILREKGTNRRAFLDGAVDKYTWVDHGSSFLAPDYVAAFLLAQLDEFDSIQAKRKHIWDTYASELKDWAKHVGAQLPNVPDYAIHTSHLFWITLPSPADRTSFMNFLKASGITSTFHYQSLAISPAGKRFGRTDGTPVSDMVAQTLVRLPLFADMTSDQLAKVVDTVASWTPNLR
jgi:dTDP-4-amino-4,6-dideoxygalactose transaminase